MCTVEYDGDAPRVWSYRHIKRARTEHRCSSCGTTVAIGRPYWSLFFVDCDGHASTEACCDVCHRISHRFATEHGVGAPLPSSLVEFLVECVDYGDEDSKRWRRDLYKIRTRRARARAVAA